jgi:hypothetical protein
MMRLEPPPHDMATTVAACLKGITGNNALRDGVQANTAWLVALETQYSTIVAAAGLATIPALLTAGDPIIVGTLSKSHFKKLYDYYLRSKLNVDGRAIYNAIMSAAGGKCPYCGGLGATRNLDHHLPIAYFPQFSILPLNLVPACRDCNMDGKPDSYAAVQSEQIIQPYVDHARFFDEPWISGMFVPAQGSKPSRIEYCVSPPDNWPEVDKARAQRHFEEFGVADKYATQASEMVGVTLAQIEALREAMLDDAFIVKNILDPGERKAPFVNHWSRGMYQALRASMPLIARRATVVPVNGR